jgi:hypothetical protein
MAKAKEVWQTISLKPLTGVFDLRSRPADVVPGGFRWRQNWGTSDESMLCRREGHSRLFPEHLFDSDDMPLSDPNHTGTGSFYHNDDHHFQNAAPREPITFIYENTNPDGSRNLFDGTASRISRLNETTGYWDDIFTGVGASGSRWSAASLQGLITFTNNSDKPQSYNIGANSISEIAELNSLTVIAAAVVVEFHGCVFLMNVFQNSARLSSRVRWSDLNDATKWNPSTPNSIAGFQDLDYGEQILAAKVMLNVMLIYTTRAIWQCSINTAATGAAFLFQKIYSEPKNQIGCLVYPYTLVSDGLDHYYMSKEAIYHFNPYLAAPERIDWIHKADAAIYIDPLTKLDPGQCTSPVAEAYPLAKELWFSWPLPGFPSQNRWTLVLNIEQKTADIVDAGYNALANFHPNSSTSQLCSQNQVLIGASGLDWTLKQIGGVLSREFVDFTNDDITQDIPRDVATYTTSGYYSILRGIIPLGLDDRNKKIRMVYVDEDVSEQAVPCIWRLRIGHSHKLVDANDTDDSCAPMWIQLDDRPLTCPDDKKISEMKAANLTPDSITAFPCYEEGAFLFFELIVANKDGSPAIGGDVCLNRIDFDAMAMPKSDR